MFGKIRLYIVRFLAKKFLKYVDENDVLRIVNKSLYLNESKFTEEELGMLKEEANALLGSMLWKYAKRNVEYLATVKMGKNAQSRDDIFMGNAMFYDLNIIEEFLNKISKL